ncbi:MAG TPA: class I SAM-dependent methyltransferase [Burkholderiaceae bacterium]|nr:class I SAM-dependent methyltransferase [Burkholderiaceae bacterium]
MPVSFVDFLQAKFDLDERSLARDVRAAFWQALRRLPSIDCLDVGAGSGATARRLLNGGLDSPLSLTLLDRDSALLELARESTERRLRELTGEGIEAHQRTFGGQPRGEAASIHFVTADLNEYRPARRFDVITAHAFLDIVPLPRTLRCFAAWLRPGGYLYATLAYDGDTSLLPAFEDSAFEDALLAHYDDTMEHRRVDGLPTGGARCGRRLYRMLPDHGFEILACGSSDWNITPSHGQYRDGDALCLQALLEMIDAEARRSGQFDAGRLDDWLEDRLRLGPASARARRAKSRTRISSAAKPA